MLGSGCEFEPNLSGKLGHLEKSSLKIKYIGPISRFTKKGASEVYDLMVLLSGPEPQRTLLEEKLLNDLKEFKGSVIFVKGIIDEEQTKIKKGEMTIFNFMKSAELEKTINQSKMVLSRSGYTTILDLAKLEKKAFFIPTPGQFEQEYLAKRLDDLWMVPSCKQDDFKIEMLNKANLYNGLHAYNPEMNYEKLFSLFQGE